jgi:two-component system response regulator RegX3
MVTERPRSILVVEDEDTLADSIQYNLEREGYSVEIARDGRSAVDRFRAGRHDLVLLDLMLPGMSGLDVCRTLRAESIVPIIMVTAKDAEADAVAGLEVGADDYVRKPFAMRELLSRVGANLRRVSYASAPQSDAEVLESPLIKLDISRHVLEVRGEPVDLRPKEFELFEALMRRRNRLSTRDILIDEVWGPGYFGDTKTLDVHIKRLRQKIEVDPHRPGLIVTVRGLGYKLIDE